MVLRIEVKRGEFEDVLTGLQPFVLVRGSAKRGARISVTEAGTGRRIDTRVSCTRTVPDGTSVIGLAGAHLLLGGEDDEG